VPVFVRQPWLQFGKNTDIVSSDDCLSHLDLSPEDCCALELLE
jgi:hypothetical protein